MTLPILFVLLSGVTYAETVNLSVPGSHVTTLTHTQPLLGIQTVNLVPSNTPAITITPSHTPVIITPAPVVEEPDECAQCVMKRPYARQKRQWDIDHRFAHHLTDVMLRMEARRITMDASKYRPILSEFKAEIRGLKSHDKNNPLFEALDEAAKTIEALILRIERLEGALKQDGREVPK